MWVNPKNVKDARDLKYLNLVQSLSIILESIDSSNFGKDLLKKQLKDFTVENNIPFPDFMKTLRSLLSGLNVMLSFVLQLFLAF